MASPRSPTLAKLHRLQYNSPNFSRKLSKILREEDYKQCVQDIKGNELTWLLNYLDQAIGVLNAESIIYRKCLSELSRICGKKMVLPPSYKGLSHTNLAKQFGGGIRCETYHVPALRVKRVRSFLDDDPQWTKGVKQGFCKAAVTLRHLRHPNIVSIICFSFDSLEFISPWMPAHLPGYIQEHPEADRVALLSDVVKGLHYLHSCNIIHKALKGQNVLVDGTDHARITDFGLAEVNNNPHDDDCARDEMNPRNSGARWLAPEVQYGGPHNKASDIFSFAMVMVEVFTGECPFPELPHSYIWTAIRAAKRPPRPTNPAVGEPLWELMQRCWSEGPSLRPNAEEILHILAQ